MDFASAKVWTLEDRVVLLVQIIEQLTQGDGRCKINFKDIQMPGRSEKAISLQWYKIKKEASKMAADLITKASNQGSPRTPAPATPGSGRKTGSKRKAAPAAGSLNEDINYEDDYDEDYQDTPSKKLKTKAGRTVAVKKQEPEEDVIMAEIEPEPKLKVELDDVEGKIPLPQDLELSEPRYHGQWIDPADVLQNGTLRPGAEPRDHKYF